MFGEIGAVKRSKVQYVNFLIKWIYCDRCFCCLVVLINSCNELLCSSCLSRECPYREDCHGYMCNRVICISLVVFDQAVKELGSDAHIIRVMSICYSSNKVWISENIIICTCIRGIKITEITAVINSSCFALRKNGLCSKIHSTDNSVNTRSDHFLYLCQVCCFISLCKGTIFEFYI